MVEQLELSRPDFVDEISDKVDSIAKSPYRRFRLDRTPLISHMRPAKDYVHRDFDIVIQFSLDGSLEKYEATITRIPFGILDILNAQRLGQTAHFVGVGRGRYFENLVSIASSDSVDDPQWLTIPSLANIKIGEWLPYDGRQPLYISLNSSRSHSFMSPYLWKRRSTSRSHCLAENISKVLADGEGRAIDIGSDFIASDHGLYDLFSSVSIRLWDDSATILAKNGGELPFKIIDVFFGPFYCS